MGSLRCASIGLALCAIAACGDDEGGSASDAAPQSDGAGPFDWESVEEISNQDGVIVERVTYRSDGLLIHGQVCRPSRAGAHRVVVFNHGGFDGLAGDPVYQMGNCEMTASQLGVWIGSDFRGEGDSEGAIEMCQGEVDDVLAMIDVALRQEYADPDRVVMMGGSNGGCITLRALQRGAPVHAAADIFGPTDLAAAHAFWLEQIEAGAPMADFIAEVVDIVETATGGTPDQVPEAYRMRSPLLFIEDLPAGIPLLALHGVDDPLIPVTQGCALAEAAGLESYHLDENQQEVATAPAACEEADLTWIETARPSGIWPGSRYFVAYDLLGHDADGPEGAAMLADLITFMAAKTPPE